MSRLEAKVDDLLAALDVPVPNTAPPPPGLLSYWQSLRSRALLLIAVSILPAAAGWYLAQHEQKIYQARSTVELLEPGHTLNVRNLQTNNRIFGGDTYVETQVAKFRSASLLQSTCNWLAQQHLPVPAAPAAQGGDSTGPAVIRTIQNNLGVTPIRGTSLIEVTYDAPDPKLASTFVNALASEYIENDMDARALNAEQTRSWLERELQDVKAKLENSESRLQAYANSSGLLFTSPKGNAGEEAEDKLQFIAHELSEAQAKRAALEARYDVLASRTPGTEPTPGDIGAADNEILRGIQARLLDLNKERASLASQFTPEYYKVQQVNAEIAALQASQAKEYARWANDLRAQYETELRHEKLIQAAYQHQASLVSDQAAKAIHYNVLKREVDTNRNLYESLLGGMKEAGVNAAARVSNARVVDPAFPPTAPYRPNPIRNAAIGWLLGIMGGVAFVLVSATNDRRLKSPGTASICLNVPELGVIPSVKPSLMPTARRNLIGTKRYPAKAAPVADAFHSAVTSIFMSGRTAQPPKLVVVTSATAHEGKSTVVGNLGLMAAQTGRRVLLIDGDLRNPRLHRTYGVSNDYGMTSLLKESEPLAEGRALETVQPTNLERLFLLPGGPSTHDLLPLLHSERLAEALGQFRNEFDLVLIDTPPVLPFADARLFGRLSDAVILVVRAGCTSRNLALAAKARFRDDGLTLIGTILNDWNGKEPGYQYTETAYHY